MSRIKVYHFHNGRAGGVQSVISNLLKFSSNTIIENHLIYVINKDVLPFYLNKQLEGVASVQVFYYSAKWNFYHTCRQLAALLPNDKAIVIAHDWVELGMMSNLGLQNPVVQFLHGDYNYYYDLAKKHEAAIDLFVPVANNIAQLLRNVLPQRREAIEYLRFPVAPALGRATQQQGLLHIIFIGRLTAAKGYTLLPAIASKIKDSNIHLNWHIVGVADADSGTENILWNEGINVNFYGNVSNEEVMQLLPKMQLLILPSSSEGMPLVVIEAMKAGVIPFVNDISGGIQELVIDSETGYKIKGNQVSSYVEALVMLIGNKKLAGEMQQKCIATANRLFDAVINTKVIEDKIQEIAALKRKTKCAVKVYGSRLDRPWLANTITHVLRSKVKK